MQLLTQVVIGQFLMVVGEWYLGGGKLYERKFNIKQKGQLQSAEHLF